MTALHALSADALARGLAQRHISPLELTRAVLAQIERCEPRLHAFFDRDAEAALAQARASEQRWQRGQPLSPLDGVPGTLKENIATPAQALAAGSAAGSLAACGWEAPPAARWREAGLVLLGKTTMPDFGMLSSGLSSLHTEPARNPWNLQLTPGGSSAGAAAAAAAGFGPLHLGTDIGGSIRLPAGWCGLVGLKPSAGRLPICPPYAGRVAGPMTRSVRDAAWAMALLARPDPAGRDPTALPAADLDWLGATTPDDDLAWLRGLRLGLQLDAGWGLAVEPGTRGCIEAAARRFEAAGAMVTPLAAFSTRAMADGMDAFWRMRCWLELQALPATRRSQALPYILKWAEGAAGLSGAEVFRGFSQMAALRDAALAACAPFDFVLSPTSPVPAFPASWASPLDDPARPFEHIAFTLPYNMSEQPALTLHAGFTHDARFGALPVGLQIAGRRHDDLGVLRLGAAWERLRAPMPAWPMDAA